MCWINNVSSELNTWVRYRIIEINRLTHRDNWYYIGSGDNLADIGTRKGAKLCDIAQTSPWITGQEWTRLDRALILALNYFYKKATSEIKVFLKVDTYNNISVEKNGVL